MSNLIKVTYFGKNRPTIINTNKVESIYEMIDVNSQNRCTKIQFGKDNYILVDETPQEIMKMEWSVKNGEPIDMDFVSPTFDDIAKSSYDNHPNFRPQPHYQQRPPQRRRTYNQPNYNSYNSYNDNSY
jgi:hypothetical protein